MDVNAIDIFWVAIVFIKVVIALANLNSPKRSAENSKPHYTGGTRVNLTNFDITRTTR